jgi:hypothetical protein
LFCHGLDVLAHGIRFYAVRRPTANAGRTKKADFPVVADPIGGRAYFLKKMKKMQL